jgi:hypothetical protein
LIHDSWASRSANLEAHESCIKAKMNPECRLNLEHP